MFSVSAIFCCPWMFWTCCCSGNKDWCVSSFYVPQQAQEHNIHHSLKLRMYFHNFHQSPKSLYWNEAPVFNISNKWSSFLIDCIHSFCACTISYNHETEAGSIIDLSETWFTPRGRKTIVQQSLLCNIIDGDNFVLKSGWTKKNLFLISSNICCI